MGRASEADGWCILTTAAGRTLPLMRALRTAGMRAWTPARTERRLGRGKKRKVESQVETPMMPTFVFVGAEHLRDLIRVRDLPAHTADRFPRFHLMMDQNRMVPVIADASLGQLRAAEERFRLSALKSTRLRIETGTQVRMNKGAFAGLTGIVEKGGDKEARVMFGNGFSVTIASYLFGTDMVHTTDTASLGLAA